MLEWRTPFWNDNPFAKTWEELGFNEYEASHCCSGSDGSDNDGGGGGDDGGGDDGGAGDDYGGDDYGGDGNDAAGASGDYGGEDGGGGGQDYDTPTPAPAPEPTDSTNADGTSYDEVGGTPAAVADDGYDEVGGDINPDTGEEYDQAMDDYDDDGVPYADEFDVTTDPTLGMDVGEGFFDFRDNWDGKLDDTSGLATGETRTAEDMGYQPDGTRVGDGVDTDTWGDKIFGALKSLIVGVGKGLLIGAFPPAGFALAGWELKNAKTLGDAIGAVVGGLSGIKGNVGNIFSTISGVLGAKKAIEKGAGVFEDITDVSFFKNTVDNFNKGTGLNKPNPWGFSMTDILGNPVNTPVGGKGGGPSSVTGGGSRNANPFGDDGDSGGDDLMTASAPVLDQNITGRIGDTSDVNIRTTSPVMTSVVSNDMPLSETTFGRRPGRDMPYGVVSPFGGVVEELGSIYGTARAGRMKTAA